MVLKNLARLSNIRFGGNFCKFILVFDAVGINRLFLQNFQFFLSILDLLDRDDGANFHFHILFGKQLLHNRIRTMVKPFSIKS